MRAGQIHVVIKHPSNRPELTLEPRLSGKQLSSRPEPRLGLRSSGYLCSGIRLRKLAGSIAYDTRIYEQVVVIGVVLVPREHDRPYLNIVFSGDGQSAIQVGLECLAGLARFKAEIVGEGMRGQFLARAPADGFDQGGGEVQRVIRLILPDRLVVGIQGVVFVRRLHRRKELLKFLSRLREQEAHRSPRGSNVVLLEQGQHLWHRLPHAEEVSPIGAIGRSRVAYPPVEFEIQRNYYCTVSRSHL